MFNLNLSKLNTHNIIKKSSNSAIYSYQKHDQDNRWVVKHLVLKDSTELALAMHRITLAFNSDSSSILQIKGYYIQPENPSLFNLYLKMPRMKVNLAEFITQYGTKNELIPESKIIEYLYTLLGGLDYLHQKKVAHANIKGSNILIDNNEQIKLSDAGSSKTLFQKQPLDENGKFDNRALKDILYQDDIHRLGSIIMGMCSLNTKILSTDLSEPENKQLLDEAFEKMKANYPKKFTDLIFSMLNRDPEKVKATHELKATVEHDFNNIIENMRSGESIKTMEVDEENLQSNLGMLGDLDHSMSVKMQKMIETLKMNWKEYFSFESDAILSINAIDKNKITDLVLQDLMSDIVQQMKINQIIELLDFELDLSNCSRITDEGVIYIAKALGNNFKNLKLLKLYFPWCINISDQGVIQLSSHISQNIKQIQNLTLYFSKCTKISDTALEILGKDLCQLVDLQHLDLFFSWCLNITDTGVKDLSFNIGENLKHLKDLALYFSCCSMITDEGVKHLAYNISHLKKLNSLAFKVNGCYKLTDEGVKNIVSYLDTTADTLEDLVLDFYGCRNITDEGVKHLSMKLGQGFAKLKSLTILLLNCEKLTDEGAKHICSYLFKGMTSLTSLNLNLYGCKMTDEGAQRLGSSLGQNLKTLRKLILSFASCVKITDKGVKEVAASIVTNLKDLYKLSLDFSGCTKISDESVKFLALNAGGNLKNLQELSIFVAKCFKVSITLDDQFVRSLANIKKIRIC